MNQEPFEVVVIGPETSTEACLRGMLQLLLQHTGKQLSCAIDCIAEKYGHPKEELCELIRDSPKMATVLKECLALELPVKEANVKTKAGKKVVIKTKARQPTAVPPSEETKQSQ